MEGPGPGTDRSVSQLELAVAIVVANRTGRDWAWLDQDRATHER